MNLINITQYRAICSPEEIDFFGQFDLDESEPTPPEAGAFDFINNRVFTTTWPDDEFPW